MKAINRFVNPTESRADIKASITLNCNACRQAMISNHSFVEPSAVCNKCGLVWKVGGLNTGIINYSLDVEKSISFQETARAQEAERVRNKVNEALMNQYGLQMGDPCIYVQEGNNFLYAGIVSEKTCFDKVGDLVLQIDTNELWCSPAANAWPVDQLSEVMVSTTWNKDDNTYEDYEELQWWGTK